VNATFAVIVTCILLALNAFFVAGEFATTSSRRSQIEPLAEEGVRGSKYALFALEHVSLMLAICQLGVTVASTSLGVVAEPTFASLIKGPMQQWGLPHSWVHVVGFTFSLALVLFLHVVFGEMVPKNLSIANPQRLLLVLAPILVNIGHVISPVIHGMDHLANWFLRIAGVEPKSEISATFTVEEMATIVEHSQQEGMIDDDLGLLSGTLEFSTENASDVMVPLEELIILDESTTPDQVEKEVARTGFSRFPVADAQGVLKGYIHLKDVLYADETERFEPITSWRIRKMEAVPMDAEVEDALRHMQRAGAHLAEVMGADGTVTGVLFLEDILERLVGEVRDALQKDTLPGNYRS
jgi:membrane protein containing CBS domain protein